MKHFEKSKCGEYRFLVNGGRQWRLYGYDPWGGEPEKGAKYRLFESYYNPGQGEYTLSFIRTVSSIKAGQVGRMDYPPRERGV